MLSAKILKIIDSQPTMTAFIWNKKAVSYQDFGILIESSKEQITGKNERFFINSPSPIIAIAQLIACQVTGNTGLIISDDLPLIDKESIAEHYGFIDFGSDSKSRFNFLNFDNCFLGVLTSGSSGVPKVILKDNDCWELAFEHQSNVFGINSSDNLFVLDALVYSANLNAAIHALWLGATVTFGSLDTANSWGNLFIKNAISSAFLVPSHLKILANQEIGNSLKSVVTAGEKLSNNLAQSLLESHPHILLTEYYGTSELGHISYHQNREIIDFPLSVGRPFPRVNINIDEKQLYVKSPYISPEFRNCNTVGDLGIWEEGNLILLGRSGRMFNRRGLNIYAQEIEQKALAHPLIEEAYLLERLVGSQNKLHLIISTTQASPPQRNIAKALITYLQALLPAAKCPNKAIEVKTFPRLSGGKIDENKLVDIVYFSESKEEEIKNKQLSLS